MCVDTTMVLIPELDKKMAIGARIGSGIDHLSGAGELTKKCADLRFFTDHGICQQG